MANRLKIEMQLFLREVSEALKAYYQSAHIHDHLHEGFVFRWPAMALGVPIVAYDSSAISKHAEAVCLERKKPLLAC
jgi:hypothetical protein